MSIPTAQQIQDLINARVPLLTLGSVAFAGSDGNLTESNSALFWDNDNSRLGLGTTTPDTRLDLEDGAVAMAEMTDPGAASAGKVILFAEDSGGSTRLVARFPSGAAQEIAIEQ